MCQCGVALAKREWVARFCQGEHDDGTDRRTQGRETRRCVIVCVCVWFVRTRTTEKRNTSEHGLSCASAKAKKTRVAYASST